MNAPEPLTEYDLLVHVHEQLEHGAVVRVSAEQRALLEDILTVSIGETPADVLALLRTSPADELLAFPEALRSSFRAELSSALMQFPEGRKLIGSKRALSCVTRMSDEELCKLVAFQLRQVDACIVLPHIEIVQFSEIILQSHEADANNPILLSLLESLKAMTSVHKNGQTLFCVQLGSLAPIFLSELQKSLTASVRGNDAA